MLGAELPLQAPGSIGHLQLVAVPVCPHGWGAGGGAAVLCWGVLGQDLVVADGAQDPRKWGMALMAVSPRGTAGIQGRPSGCQEGVQGGI